LSLAPCLEKSSASDGPTSPDTPPALMLHNYSYKNSQLTFNGQNIGSGCWKSQTFQVLIIQVAISETSTLRTNRLWDDLLHPTAWKTNIFLFCFNSAEVFFRGPLRFWRTKTMIHICLSLPKLQI
jgi:hypothetical protein